MAVGVSLTKWLIDLVKELLLELIVLDEVTDAGETLGDLVWRESPH